MFETKTLNFLSFSILLGNYEEILFVSTSGSRFFGCKNDKSCYIIFIVHLTTFIIC